MPMLGHMQPVPDMRETQDVAATVPPPGLVLVEAGVDAAAKTSTRPANLPQLTSLRFFAALLVLDYHHADSLPWPRTDRRLGLQRCLVLLRPVRLHPGVELP